MHRARSLVGEPYDWAGLFGIDDGDRYYCSEFVLVVADQDGVIDRPTWVTPAGLLDVAHVIYDGGVRDAERTRRLARRRLRRRHLARQRRAPRYLNRHTKSAVWTAGNSPVATGLGLR
jgi:hypothetical protein